MNETLKLECGCVMTNEGKVFLIKPCSTLCKNFIWVIEESEKRGNEIMYTRIKELMK